MNLNELDLTKILKQNWHPAAETVRNIVKKYGWHVLGEGSEALVAHKPGADYVLKLFENTSKYSLFVSYCQQHPDNSFVPRFSRYVKPVPGTSYSYVRMEKLLPVTNYELMKDYPEYLCAIHLLFKQKQGKVWWNSAMQRRDLDQLFFRHGFVSLEDCAQKAPPQFIQTIKDLVAIMQLNKLEQFDLHSGNMMIRQPGQLVITDPLI